MAAGAVATCIGGVVDREKQLKEENGACSHKDGEEVFQASHREVLLSDDPRLPHQQEGSGRGGPHPFKEAP